MRGKYVHPLAQLGVPPVGDGIVLAPHGGFMVVVVVGLVVVVVGGCVVVVVVVGAVVIEDGCVLVVVTE